MWTKDKDAKAPKALRYLFRVACFVSKSTIFSFFIFMACCGSEKPLRILHDHYFGVLKANAMDKTRIGLDNYDLAAFCLMFKTNEQVDECYNRYKLDKYGHFKDPSEHGDLHGDPVGP